MRRRLLIVSISTLLALPFAAFAVYDLVVFQSQRENIDKLLASASPDERQPTESLRRLFRISLNDHTAAFAARVLIRELPVRINGTLGWHTTNVLWWGLVALHLSEDEQVALITSRSYMGRHAYGFSAESVARFGRPLGSLTVEEEAALVALCHAPSLYSKEPNLLVMRTEWLLRELHNSL